MTDFVREYVLGKFRQDIPDNGTGLDSEGLKRVVGERAAELERAGVSRRKVKAELFKLVVEKMRIETDPRDWFPAIAVWNRQDRPLKGVLQRWDREVDENDVPDVHDEVKLRNHAGVHEMWKDFDHSVPDWDAVLKLGFPGLLARAESIAGRRRSSGRMDRAAEDFHAALEMTARASQAFVVRLSERARSQAQGGADASGRLAAEARALAALAERPPQTSYEVLLAIWAYFFLSEHVDHMQVRSLGNLDRLLSPYYEADLAAGRTTEAQFREQFACFLLQWGSIDNYWGQPVYLGGTKADGTTEYCALSMLMLDVADELALPTPKFQLKVADNTPTAVLDKAFGMVRRHRSLVFCGEKPMARVMAKMGFTAEQARTCDLKGCYEFGPRGEYADTISAYVNLLKPFEFVFHDGQEKSQGICIACGAKRLSEMTSFGDFKEAYFLYLREAVRTAMRLSADWERYLGFINPSNLLTLSCGDAVADARDAFQDGLRYNHSTILQTGLGSAADALSVVRELVFERRELTLEGFRRALDANWMGHEDLRRRILRSKRRYGNGCVETDALAAEIARRFGEWVNFKPNSRGGLFFASGHCAKQFTELGKKTLATPDGRKDGEEMSKNVSPAMGADANGVTAMIRSVTSVDACDLPGDFPVDVMLHPSAVRGREGNAALAALLRVYFDRGGCAVHFNVVSADELREAQRHPERYGNLQIRVCGWNVRWNDVPSVEQDEYIRRAEVVA